MKPIFAVMEKGKKMNLIDFKVIYGDKVLNAVAIDFVDFGHDIDFSKPQEIITKPKSLGVLAINEDGNIIRIFDEAWRFQFIPIINGERSRQ